MEVATKTAVGKLPPLSPGEFRFVTKALSIEPESDGKRRFHTIASSTVKDLGKDEMKVTALEDMAQSFQRGLNIFMNHSYKVPEDVFGRSDSAEIRDSGERSKSGAVIWDLHIGGVVNDPNPRAAQLANSMEGGYVTFGTSVGAIVKAHQRNKDGGMDIEHVDCKEGSIVGIPMNQRSWTQKAAKAAQTLDEEGSGLAEEDEDDEPSEAIVEAEETAKSVDPLTPDEAAIVSEVLAELDTVKGDLSAEARGNLDAGEFACPEKRKYPINDKAHVRAALSRVADPSNDQCGKEKILAAARRMGIGDHKDFTDDELLIWAAENIPLAEVEMTEKAMCAACAHAGGCDCGDCSCDDQIHATTHENLPVERSADDAVLDTIKSTTEGGQEADPAATPETAPDDTDGSDPAIEQKAIEFESEDVVALVRKTAHLVEMIGDRDETIATLRKSLDEVTIERDRLASENKEAVAVIERVMALPLRPRAQGHIADLTKRLPEFFAPEVRDFLTKTAGDSE